jgi:AcrR family transcriptional regulator
MAQPRDTPERLIRAAEQLFRVQGYSGTGLKQLTAEAKAPWGSLYHHFPAGKAELGAAAARWAGGHYAEGLRRALASGASPGAAIEGLFTAEARVLEGSGYRNGCPIAATTVDAASLDEGLRESCASAFSLWREAIADGLVRHGAAPAEAQALAQFTLSALEGAIVLARAARSPEALLVSGRLMRATVDRTASAWRRPSA